MPSKEELEAAGVTLLPCRYCHSENTRLFQLNQYVQEQAKRMDIATVECLDCRASAPLNVWNSTAKPLVINGKHYENYETSKQFPVTEKNRDEALSRMVMELADMFAVFPRNQVDHRAWRTLMIYAPKDLCSDPLLISHLHEKQAHPFYEYKSTSTARKSGTEIVPDGLGWRINTHMGRDGWERDDFTDTTYWMRSKEDAATDEINVFELPTLTLQPVRMSEVRDMLRQTLPPSHMPSSENPDAQLPGNIMLCSAEDIYTLGFNNGLYKLQEGQSEVWVDAVDRKETLQLSKDGLYYAIHLGKPAVELLAVVSDPECPIWIRAMKKNTDYGNWQRLPEFATLNLNKYVIREIIQGSR